MQTAETENNRTYNDVISSGLGSLQCLGCEVYGRWGPQSVALVPALARERCRNLLVRIRRGTTMGLLHRWCCILGITLQRAVAHTILNEYADLPTANLEPACPLDGLEVV